MTSDQHICLSCNQTIQGLDNYVHHRTKECISHDKLSVKCVIPIEHELFVKNSSYEDKDNSETIKHESTFGLINVFEKSIKNSLFDLNIQKELDKMDFKRFFNLIKQNETNSHQTDSYDPPLNVPNDIQEYSTRGISIANILERCRALTFCSMFIEGTTDQFALKRQEKFTNLDTDSYLTGQTRTTDISFVSFSSSDQNNPEKNMAIDHNNHCSSGKYRKIITRLSVGIRKPSCRYLPDDPKIPPKETRSSSLTSKELAGAKSDATYFNQIGNLKESHIPSKENISDNPNLEIENKSSHEICSPLARKSPITLNRDFFVECLICKGHFSSASEFLNHLKSPCLTKFQEHSPNNLGLKTIESSNQSVESSSSMIKRKKGRPPKVIQNSKKSSNDKKDRDKVTISQSTPVCTGMLLNLRGKETEEDAETQSSCPENMKPQGTRKINLEDKNQRDDSVTEKIITFKQEGESSDESFTFDDQEKQIWCNICGLGFLTLEKLKSHKIARTHLRKIEEMKSGDGKNYKCQRCGRLFYALNVLQFHELNHMLADARKTRKKSGVATIDKREACDAEYNLLSRHLISESEDEHTLVTCPECKKKIPKIKISNHLRKHGEGLPFKCTFCLKQFANVAVMRRHLRVHLGIMYYKCPVCQKEFNRKSTMQSHALREHGADEVGKHGVLPPSHQCCHCGRQFMELSQLTAHMKLHDKQLKCPHLGCTSLFRYKSELLVHFQTHSTERKFLCDECGYSGKSRHQLKRHQRLHAGDKRYQCDQCSYKTTLAANLRRHERVHTGSKPYKCLYCGYSCNTQENLRKHILKTRRHAGKYVYPCQMCSFATNSAQDFQHHLETEHQKDRQTLPSILVGMYQPDDKKNKINTGPSDETRPKISNRGARKKSADNQKVFKDTTSSSPGKFLERNHSPNSIIRLPVNQSVQLEMEHSTLSPEVGSNQTVSQTQDSLSQSIISQLIIPTSHQGSFIDALLQIQAANYTLQNNFQLPLVSLASPTTMQHTRMILPQATNQSNINYALQVTNNSLQINNINTGSNQIQRLATIIPNNLILLLQSPDGKILLDNNRLQNLVVPGSNDKESTDS